MLTLISYAEAAERTVSTMLLFISGLSVVQTYLKTAQNSVELISEMFVNRHVLMISKSRIATKTAEIKLVLCLQRIIKDACWFVMVIESHVQKSLLTAPTEVATMRKMIADKHATSQKLDHLNSEFQLNKTVIWDVREEH